MTEGRVLSIQIAPVREGPMQRLKEVRAVAGRGLEGDRYFLKAGTYSDRHGPDREVTLVEVEAIDALAREFGVRIEPQDSRRNLTTRGVALNGLVGREFFVGEVLLRGIRLCEPCEHLARLVGKDVVPGLVHRGGLRASIQKEGTIRIGDPIRPAGRAEPDPSAREESPVIDH